MANNWPRWIGLIKPYWTERGGIHADTPKDLLVTALDGPSQAGPKPTAKAEIGYRLYAMAKGWALMRSAVLDEKPVLGRGTPRDEPTDLDSLRGLQWRLVMFMGGFEVFLRGRTGKLKGKKPAPMRDLATAAGAHVSRARCPKIIPIPSLGSREGNLERWLDDVESAHGPSFHTFFDINTTSRELFVKWSRTPESVMDWDGQISIAWTLRNMTSHGALSAKKVRQLRLRTALGRLPDTLFGFAEATLAPAINALKSPAIE